MHAVVQEHKLSLRETLAILRRLQVLNARTIERIEAGADPRDGRHPFVHIAAYNLNSGGETNFPLTVETITRLVAEATKLPYYRIDPLKIDVTAITALVPQAYATRFQFLPVEVTEHAVTIVTAQPFVREWETEIEPILKRKIVRALANPQDIERYIQEFYGVSRSLNRAEIGKASERSDLLTNFEQLTQLGSVGEPDADDRHIVHLVDWLLQYAFEQRASDIHIEPRRAESLIRFRIDGVLHLVHKIPTSVVGAIVSRVKSLGRMDVADKRRPQDGRLKTKTPQGRETELRLSTMPTAFGEKLVLRIFNPEKLEQSFTALGFSRRDAAAWNAMAAHPHGVILVTGPTGSGKTTTLYAALRQLASPEVNVCTIEDPIEMIEAKFNQMQVQPAIEVSFASGVRTLLRQDPDIIMVGEIRDRETADVAIQAALTGHLVFSTLHTNDAPSALTRLMDLGIEPYLIGATMLGAIAQRLVRTLCPHCRIPGAPDSEAWRRIVAPEKIPAPERVYDAGGCDECRHTGYLGREGIYEIMVVDDDLRALIKPSVQPRQLRAQAASNGMRVLRLAGANKIAAGKTTFEEVLRTVPPPSDDLET